MAKLVQPVIPPKKKTAIIAAITALVGAFAESYLGPVEKLLEFLSILF